MRINNQQLADLSFYLDGNLREEVHADLAPCENDAFIAECLRRDAKLTYEAAELAGVVDVVRAIDHGL